ncbi:hypothetical protein ABW19_dt0202899 [Dactylella cylindrospora]|nr:hypothetical protein ABW19_dt0202899 [Dactylella cylindrospora]
MSDFKSPPPSPSPLNEVPPRLLELRLRNLLANPEKREKRLRRWSSSSNSSGSSIVELMSPSDLKSLNPEPYSELEQNLIKFSELYLALAKVPSPTPAPDTVSIDCREPTTSLSQPIYRTDITNPEVSRPSGKTRDERRNQRSPRATALPRRLLQRRGSNTNYRAESSYKDGYKCKLKRRKKVNKIRRRSGAG